MFMDGTGLFGLARGCCRGAGFGQLSDGKAGESESLAAGLGTVEIAGDELSLRPLLHPADGNNANAHKRSVRVGGEVRLPHLFDVVELAHLGPEDVDDHVAT